MRKILSYLMYLTCVVIISCSDEEVTPDTRLPDDNLNRYLALGDSYTIGESVPATGRFPIQLTDSLRERGFEIATPRVIATTGWTTGNLLTALGQEQPNGNYDLVTLLIGVNNQFQGRSLEEYEREFRELLDMAIGYAMGNKDRVIVVSIPDYGYTPFGAGRQEQISRGVDQFNEANRRITDSMNVAYVNITPISRNGLDRPELVANDGLHPSAIQYSEWVELLIPEAQRILEAGN
ncbi:SGNH/GDSL hydrolase family protein [Roseivirga sp. BDSF3-8]|uniref:SGNH/GDSL hydrolase family protein n=1 Tax=Roseivirga sp. BDSF3-8 TaxID=3241598 RepID=UPI003532572F